MMMVNCDECDTAHKKNMHALELSISTIKLRISGGRCFWLSTIIYQRLKRLPIKKVTKANMIPPIPTIQINCRCASRIGLSNILTE